MAELKADHAAFMVQVFTTQVVLGKRVAQYWIAVTDTPEEAIAAVRKAVPPGIEVTSTTHPVTAKTTRAMGLAKGQVWAI